MVKHSVCYIAAAAVMLLVLICICMGQRSLQEAILAAHSAVVNDDRIVSQSILSVHIQRSPRLHMACDDDAIKCKQRARALRDAPRRNNTLCNAAFDCKDWDWFVAANRCSPNAIAVPRIPAPRNRVEFAQIERGQIAFHEDVGARTIQSELPCILQPFVRHMGFLMGRVTQ